MSELVISKVIYNGAEYFNVPLDGGDLGIPRDVLIAALNDQAWGLVRAERDRRIAATDYTQMPDSPFTEQKRLEFAAYRKALRDVPQTYKSPVDVDWPVIPAIE